MFIVIKKHEKSATLQLINQQWSSLIQRNSLELNKNNTGQKDHLIVRYRIGFIKHKKSIYCLKHHSYGETYLLLFILHAASPSNHLLRPFFQVSQTTGVSCVTWRTCAWQAWTSPTRLCALSYVTCPRCPSWTSATATTSPTSLSTS